MTYRERRLRRAQRLQEWADKREAKADQAYADSNRAVEGIPFGQPILVGHHSEGKMRRAIGRAQSKATQSIEHSAKAEEMRSRADNILAAADHAIYSDDPDAIERLRVKLAGLEAERDGIKAYNASCRKGTPDTSVLSAKSLKDLESTKKYTPYFLGPNDSMPSYVLSNLNGNINRTRKRLAALERRAA